MTELSKDSLDRQSASRFGYPVGASQEVVAKAKADFFARQRAARQN